jgi:hypothetical protein
LNLGHGAGWPGSWDDIRQSAFVITRVAFATETEASDGLAHVGGSAQVRVAPIALRQVFSKSRMREIRPSGLMRGGGWPTHLGLLTATLRDKRFFEIPRIGFVGAVSRIAKAV